MTVLFWYISKSVLSSFPVSVLDILEFFLNAIFRVGICWFQKYIYICPFIKKKCIKSLVPLTARGEGEVVKFLVDCTVKNISFLFYVLPYTYSHTTRNLTK